MKLIVIGLLICLFSVIISCQQNQQLEPNILQNKEPAKDSPIGVLKTFTDAKNNKDAEAMKKTLSKNTLETISGVAEGHKLTLEEYLNKGNTTPLNKPEMPEARNEIIENNSATVEIKRSSSDSWRKLTFVKEENHWKMDLVKFLEELYPKMKK